MLDKKILYLGFLNFTLFQNVLSLIDHTSLTYGAIDQDLWLVKVLIQDLGGRKKCFVQQPLIEFAFVSSVCIEPNENLGGQEVDKVIGYTCLQRFRGKRVY